MSLSRPDYIVVGAGSAGCVMASRLAHLTGGRILLVEAPTVTEAPANDRNRPRHWLRLLGSPNDWNHATEPTPTLANRRLAWPRGRGLGGSSRINAMIWFPPTPSDLESLRAASGGQWSRQLLDEALESIETMVAPESPRWLSDAGQWFMRHANHLCDTEHQPMVYHRCNRNGRRWNAGQLLADFSDQRITVLRANVDRVEVSDQRVVGIRVVSNSGDCETILCRHGVVMCAGAIGTPTILMRSGIGSDELLRRHQIPVRAEQEGVGKNLSDHLLMPLVYATRGNSFSSEQNSVRDIARWQIAGTGKLVSNIAECGGLFQNQSLQLHVTPTHYLTYPKASATGMMTLGINLTQPKSRGELEISSALPADPPKINTGYLSDPDDLAGLVKGVNWARRWLQSIEANDWIVEEIIPGAKRVSDDAIAKTVARFAQTLYHPVGTCRFGHHIDTPVDPKFQFRNLDCLWCADASVLPGPTIGNPNATVMTLAWMAAASISEQAIGEPNRRPSF
ncbi:GMC family oxidoreductase [Rubripirellula amarantea]|uniref:GMC family oxidoreductase n=1 Tax=Rubripirellula amarantea TaxID=2527999 RepID=UPI0013EF4623|nr:GMC family oxidoreductase [Rubripirellula amarantea]